jgi:hypothetical protein
VFCHISLEIIMVMIAAAGVEICGACRAGVFALHILADGKFMTTDAAEDCLLVPFFARPDEDVMIGECIMTLFTSVIDSATFHLDGNYVHGQMIVSASRL